MSIYDNGPAFQFNSNDPILSVNYNVNPDQKIGGSDDSLYNQIYNPLIPLKFDKNYNYDSYQVNSNINITIDKTNLKDGKQILIELIGDGSHNINLGNIINLGDDFDNTINTSNFGVLFPKGEKIFIKFFYTEIKDLISPTLTSAIVSSDNLKRIKLLYNEILDSSSVPTINQFSISGSTTGIATISLISISNTYVYLDVVSNFVGNESISLSYTGNSIKDNSGNIASVLSNQIINNNILQAVNINWVQGSNATITNNNVLFTTTTGQVISNQKISAGTNGWVQMKITTVNDTTQAMLGLDSAPGLEGWGGFTYLIYQAGPYFSPAGSTTSVSAVDNDLIRMEKVTNGANKDLLIKRSTDNGINFTTIKTYSNIPDVDLYIKGGANIANKNILDAKGFNLVTF